MVDFWRGVEQSWCLPPPQPHQDPPVPTLGGVLGHRPPLDPPKSTHRLPALAPRFLWAPQ